MWTFGHEEGVIDHCEAWIFNKKIKKPSRIQHYLSFANANYSTNSRRNGWITAQISNLTEENFIWQWERRKVRKIGKQHRNSVYHCRRPKKLALWLSLSRKVFWLFWQWKWLPFSAPLASVSAHPLLFPFYRKFDRPVSSALVDSRIFIYMSAFLHVGEYRWQRSRVFSAFGREYLFWPQHAEVTLVKFRFSDLDVDLPILRVRVAFPFPLISFPEFTSQYKSSSFHLSPFSRDTNPRKITKSPESDITSEGMKVERNRVKSGIENFERRKKIWNTVVFAVPSDHKWSYIIFL